MSSVEELIEVVNKLSDDAVYMASCDWFGQVIMNKPVLAAAQNERQTTAFEELMAAGFVYLDTERGHVGYRSTHRGREAAGICRAAFDGPKEKE